LITKPIKKPDRVITARLQVDISNCTITFGTDDETVKRRVSHGSFEEFAKDLDSKIRIRRSLRNNNHLEITIKDDKSRSVSNEVAHLLNDKVCEQLLIRFDSLYLENGTKYILYIRMPRLGSSEY
jgi:hypothetical protein